MTPREFIEKWKDNPLKESASYQLHFIDLCALVGVEHPAPSTAASYCFERGATRTGAGQSSVKVGSFDIAGELLALLKRYIAREDDATFGVLSSRIYEVWALVGVKFSARGSINLDRI
jgi:hypothetical protein